MARLTVAGLGYALPYLDRFRDGAGRCLALMPSQHGAVVWPDQEKCASALVWADMLPLPDASIDRLLVAHALEAVERPETLLEEVWRVTAPEGRVIVVVPSRRGIWARTDGTPFGQGSPYSRGQLRELLNRASSLADLLGRGAVFSTDREELCHSLGSCDRTARGRSELSVRRGAWSWKRSSRSIGRSGRGSSPGGNCRRCGLPCRRNLSPTRIARGSRSRRRTCAPKWRLARRACFAGRPPGNRHVSCVASDEGPDRSWSRAR